MPYHISTAHSDPARTILWLVGLLTLIAQVGALLITVPWYLGLPNLIIVAPVAVWAIVSAHKKNYKHMARSSFWLSMFWGWTGMLRLIIVEGIGELLWVPFIVVSGVMAVVYLYMSYHKRVGDLD